MADEEKKAEEQTAVTPIEAVKGTTFLERRIEYFLQMMKDEKLDLDPCANIELRNELALDLYNIQRFPNGRIDLETCTPLVRSIARSQYAFKDIHFEEETEPGRESKPRANDDFVAAKVPSNPFAAQRELFAIYSEFFQRFTEEDAASFAGLDTFNSEFKRKGADFAKNMPDAMQWLREAGSEYYRDNFKSLPASARAQGGVKLIVGGSERFLATTVRSVQSMLLYSDTILIPDPGSPWLAVDRREEQFPTISLLASVFFLLALKPVIDADLPYPAIMIVPTFDRRLTLESEETQDLISRFLLEFFSVHLEKHFEDESEIYQYAAIRNLSFSKQSIERGFSIPQVEMDLKISQRL